MSNNVLVSTIWHSVKIVRAIEIAGCVSRWRQQHFYRRELGRLRSEAPHMIDDIGLTMDEVETELAKPFWR